MRTMAIKIFLNFTQFVSILCNLILNVQKWKIRTIVRIIDIFAGFFSAHKYVWIELLGMMH